MGTGYVGPMLDGDSHFHVLMCLTKYGQRLYKVHLRKELKVTEEIPGDSLSPTGACAADHKLSRTSTI